MPNREYTPEEKKLVRRLLLVHNGDVAIVHQLTGFPERTIRYWRRQWDDDYEFLSNGIAGNRPLPAMANDAPKHASIPDVARDSAFAENADSFAEFAQLRQTLMAHTTTLADTLLLGDGLVHQRVQAVSRLLDRILALDEILPAQTPDALSEPEPQHTIRHEFYYDGAVQDKPPWDGVSTYEGAKQYNERYLTGMKGRMDKQLAEQYPDEFANDPDFRQIAAPEHIGGD